MRLATINVQRLELAEARSSAPMAYLLVAAKVAAIVFANLSLLTIPVSLTYFTLSVISYIALARLDGHISADNEFHFGPLSSLDSYNRLDKEIKTERRILHLFSRTAKKILNDQEVNEFFLTLEPQSVEAQEITKMRDYVAQS
jgi:hypothetical protein